MVKHIVYCINQCQPNFISSKSAISGSKYDEEYRQRIIKLFQALYLLQKCHHYHRLPVTYPQLCQCVGSDRLSLLHDISAYFS